MLLTNYGSLVDSEERKVTSNCKNWYALYTMTGNEKPLFNKIKSLYGNYFNLYLPTREVTHTIRGNEMNVQIPLFPGYLFVHENIEELVHEMGCCCFEKFSKPVSANGKYLKVSKREMKRLFDIGGESGVVSISKGYIDENSMVNITNGPLKNFKGEILFINRRKKKAKVRVEMLSRMVEVSLGLELVEKPF